MYGSYAWIGGGDDSITDSAPENREGVLNLINTTAAAPDCWAPKGINLQPAEGIVITLFKIGNNKRL